MLTLKIITRRKKNRWMNKYVKEVSETKDVAVNSYLLESTFNRENQ
jgi:hypothetical protein